MVDTEWKLSDLALMDKVTSSVGFNDEQLELLVGGVGTSKKVLDLCLGFGNLASLLVKKGNRVYGLDKNQNSIEYVRQKVGRDNPNFSSVVGDVYKIGFDSEFDVVTCASTIGSMEDVDLISRGVYRSLKSKGKVVLTGMEKSRQERYLQKCTEEIVDKLTSGKLELSDEEAQRIAELKSESYEFKDSKVKMVNSLTGNGFRILDSRPFYEGIGYYLRAEKVE